MRRLGRGGGGQDRLEDAEKWGLRCVNIYAWAVAMTEGVLMVPRAHRPSSCGLRHTRDPALPEYISSTATAGSQPSASESVTWPV